MFRRIVYFTCLMIFPSMMLSLQQDGWIPLTREEVIKNLGGGATRRFIVTNMLQDQGHLHDFLKMKNEAIKIVTPQNNAWMEESTGSTHLKKVSSNVNDYLKQCNSLDCAESQEKNTEHLITQTDTATQAYNRRAKKLRDIASSKLSLQHLSGSVLGEQTGTHLDDLTNELIDNDHNRNAYKVTEIIADDTNSEKAISGYNYGVPTINPETETKLNLTNTLSNILSKYYIKSEDDLPNYILSRRHRVRNPNFMSIPEPLKIPLRFNSFNHFAVDPLLAVFLSNYGYYLPGLYGIQNKYRNLYGYLASNNLHNNKPFGSYKLFSDTKSY